MTTRTTRTAAAAAAATDISSRVHPQQADPPARRQPSRKQQQIEKDREEEERQKAARFNKTLKEAEERTQRTLKQAEKARRTAEQKLNKQKERGRQPLSKRVSREEGNEDHTTRPAKRSRAIEIPSSSAPPDDRASSPPIIAVRETLSSSPVARPPRPLPARNVHLHGRLDPDRAPSIDRDFFNDRVVSMAALVDGLSPTSKRKHIKKRRDKKALQYRRGASVTPFTSDLEEDTWYRDHRALEILDFTIQPETKLRYQGKKAPPVQITQLAPCSKTTFSIDEVETAIKETAEKAHAELDEAGLIYVTFKAPGKPNTYHTMQNWGSLEWQQTERVMQGFWSRWNIEPVVISFEVRATVSTLPSEQYPRLPGPPAVQSDTAVETPTSSRRTRTIDQLQENADARAIAEANGLHEAAITDHWKCKDDKCPGFFYGYCFVSRDNRHYDIQPYQQKVWAKAISREEVGVSIRHPPQALLQCWLLEQGPRGSQAVPKVEKKDKMAEIMDQMLDFSKQQMQFNMVAQLQRFGGSFPTISPLAEYPQHHQAPPLQYQAPPSVQPSIKPPQTESAPSPPKTASSESSAITEREDELWLPREFFDWWISSVSSDILKERLRDARTTVLQELWDLDDLRAASQPGSDLYKTITSYGVPEKLVRQFRAQIHLFKPWLRNREELAERERIEREHLQAANALAALQRQRQRLRQSLDEVDATKEY